MDKLIIDGASKLIGEIKVSGAKNVAMKVILAGLLTDESIVVKNVPLISSVYGTAEFVKHLGVSVDISSNHSMHIKGGKVHSSILPLELGGFYRTAPMVMAPLLARSGKAVVPNPGGCRIGKRPIDRHIQGLSKLGAKIVYKDGFFHAKASKLTGTRFTFDSNSHTGTETMLLAGVLASGETVLENAAEEPEVDDLIALLNQMGAKVKRIKSRTIVIQGVKKLKGTHFTIMPDRNEVVTFAIGAIASGGDVIIEGVQREYLDMFLSKLTQAKANWKPISRNKTRFWKSKDLQAVDMTTQIYPGFMTDWQAPWALLMTQAKGVSIIHETIFEDRFGYVSELQKMGAYITFFHPKVKNPSTCYNFNWSDRIKSNFHGIKITGPTRFHNAVLEVMDLRAGATLILGGILAHGRSTVLGIEHIDRGYEKIEEKLQTLGATIKRIQE